MRLVDVSFSNNSASVGGAVLSRQEAIFNRVEFKGNNARTLGGAVTIIGNARFFDTDFGGDLAEDGNHANIRVFNVHGDGGALALLRGGVENSTSVTVIGGTFKNNSAGLDGGAIYVGEGASLSVIAGTEIESNRAEPRFPDGPEVNRGGGISNFGTTLLASTSISNNQSVNFGGGIYSDGSLTIISSSISANQARIRGGGIEVAGGSARLFSSTIGGDSLAEGNLAGVFGVTGLGNGGGVFVSGGSGTRFQMNRGQISSNTAVLSGGGLLSLAGNVVRFDNGVQVTSNRALSQDGGGAYNHGAHFEIRDAVFEGNTARRGAGIFNNVGSATLTNSVLTDNTARLEAGGFYNRSVFGSIGSEITDNFATTFPNVFDETA